ncbi:YopT-type cysteine protease domain-containing protein [Pelagibaculum spongiae]|nr:YopT-type cysteine protease domain-containing protein [Pelagibaculum spongiae]
MLWEEKLKRITAAAKAYGGFINDEFNQTNYFGNFKTKAQVDPSDQFAKYRYKLNQVNPDGFCWALSLIFLQEKGDSNLFFQRITKDAESYQVKDYQSALALACNQLIPLNSIQTLQRIMAPNFSVGSIGPQSTDLEEIGNIIERNPRGYFAVMFDSLNKTEEGHAIAAIELEDIVQIFEPNFGMFVFPKESNRPSVIQQCTQFIGEVNRIAYENRLPQFQIHAFHPIDLPLRTTSSLSILNPASRIEQMQRVSIISTEHNVEYYPRPINEVGMEFRQYSIHRSDIVIPSDFRHLHFHLSLCYFFLALPDNHRNYSRKLHFGEFPRETMHELHAQFGRITNCANINTALSNASRGQYATKFLSPTHLESEVIPDLRFLTPDLLKSNSNKFIISLKHGHLIHIIAILKKQYGLYIYQANTGIIFIPTNHVAGLLNTINAIMFKLCKELLPSLYKTMEYRCHELALPTYQNCQPIMGASTQT